MTREELEMEMERLGKELSAARGEAGLMRAVFQKASDAMFLESLDDRIVDVNRAACDLMGYSRDQLLSMTVADLQAPEIRSGAGGIIRDELTLHQGGVFEGLNLHRDGRRIPVEISTRFIEETGLVLSIVRDITRRKEYEKKLEQSRTHYREYYDELLSGAYISSPSGKLLECNREYLRIFGFASAEEALSFPVQKLYDNPGHRDRFLESVRDGGKVRHFETVMVKKDGIRIHVLENASGIFDQSGELTGIRGFLLDITDIKSMERRLLQAQKMEAIGTLASGIAHDFNNILSGIFGYAQLAKNRLGGDHTADRDLDQIVAGARRATELVHQILTFSRQTSLEKKPMKVHLVIREALRLLRSSIPVTIEIREEIRARDSVKADPTQIHQVIMNLCTNAYHAMRETGGTLTVALTRALPAELRRPGDSLSHGKAFLRLEVTDTGHGMDAGVLARVFDPYFTTKGQGQGTGLGLSVVHGIVKEHGGFIRVTSTPGRGSTFLVYLPCSGEPGETVPAAEPEGNPAMGGRERILLAEDEEGLRFLCTAFLERYGYEVTALADGEKALGTFLQAPDRFDLVITDMTMPRMTGYDMARKMLEIRPDLPVILCTGHNDTITEERVLGLGIRRYLEKPLQMHGLVNLVKQELDRNLSRK